MEGSFVDLFLLKEQEKLVRKQKDMQLSNSQLTKDLHISKEEQPITLPTVINIMKRAFLNARN